jgi:16S rRNA (uracil1498-N3)-methyltransferase
MERSQVKNPSQDRLERIAIAGLKQSRSSWLMNICQHDSFSKWLAQVKTEAITHGVFGYSGPMVSSQPLFKVGTSSIVNHIVIGPEGDFSADEIDLLITNKFQPVLLGNSRLRTETAAIAAVSFLKMIDVNEESAV